MKETPWYHKLLNLLVAFTMSFSGVIIATPAEPVLASAPLTVTPITWDVVGLDHNRPLTSGPQHFPVGAEVCNNSGAARDITVELIWDSTDTTYINDRPGSLTTLNFPSVADGECFDAYFEIELTRSKDAFGNVRPYRIVASYDGGAVQASTPAGRQIYIERLVSQNRNTTLQIRYCDPDTVGEAACDPDTGTGWVILGGGSSINLAIGGRYYIELITHTATAYEQIQSFLTLSNTIFQVLSVSTTYSTLTAPGDRILVPNPQLWGDGCLWDSDPDSPNYNSCLSTGKAGGEVTTLYEISIIAGGGESVGLEALIYDVSGGSFHYNTDFSQSPGDLVGVDPTDAGFSKRFIPSSIGADGKATLRFTIVNPNPVPVSGYNFTDTLPGDMVVYDPANESSTCGGTITATVGSDTVAFSGGALDPNSSCTIRVDVTVPYSATETYPISLTNEAELYVGTATTGVTATATLEVTEEPPPPLVCEDIAPGTELAAWTTFNSATNPDPTSGVISNTASAQGGSGLDFAVNNPEWRAQAQVANQTLAQARAASAYYEFRLDTTGIDSVDFSLEAFRRNGNAPESITLFYGPEGEELTQSTTLIGVPNQNNRPGARNFFATGLTNLNPAGVTVFRVYAYGASNTQQPISLLDVLLEGEGEICTPVDPEDAPDPPELSKAFVPSTARVGEEVTLTFTITNPNTEDALTGLTFRDELPTGMTVVENSFDNDGCGGSWGLENDNPSILLFSGGSLAADTSCTLSVTVVSTQIGENANFSDPIDATETYPGNSAEDTLTVLPPPALPSIIKFFDANPLLDSSGSSRLTFRITNNDPGLPIAGVAFTDVLPEVDSVQMKPVDPLSSGDNGACGPAYSFTWDGTNTLSFSDGEIAAGGVCEVWIEIEVSEVDVSDGPVQFPNQTSVVSHVFEGITYEGNQASATLLVDDPIPGIVIQKQIGLTDDPEGVWSNYLAVEVGDQVYYKITVGNIGETVLSNISVVDPDVDTSSCPWTAPSFTLPVADASDPEGHIAVCIVGSVTVTTAGVVPNTATASADEIADDVEDVAIYATAELTMTKLAEPTIYFTIGNVITYTFVVTNSGHAILSGPVTISDTTISPDPIACPPLSTIGNLNNFFDPDEVITCTATYTITEADVDAGEVENTAFASAGGFDSLEDEATVIWVNPELELHKSATPQTYGWAGDQITYTFTVTNTGNVTLTNIIIDDPLLPGLDCGAPIASLSPEESVTLECTGNVYTIVEGDITEGTVTNTATITGTYAGEEYTATDEETVEFAAADLALTKTVNDATPNVGDEITFTITVSNLGPDAATGVEVTDQLPAGLAYVSDNPSQGSYDEATGVWTVGALAFPGSATLEIVATVTADAFEGVTNTAEITASDQFDPDEDNNEAEQEVTPLYV